MFNSGILDVAVGLVFVYLILSLMSTAANELIEARLKHRAGDLARGLREMLDDPGGTGLVKQLYDHPLINSLFQGAYDPKSTKNLPSYINARNFALALMDLVKPAETTPSEGNATLSGAAGGTDAPSRGAASINSLSSLRDSISQIQSQKVRQALLTLVDAAGDDITKARENIEGWFDSSMDRVSGWYKRRVQRNTIIIGLIAAILVNADTIAIATRLSYDVTLRDSLVAAAQEYAKSNTGSAQPVSPNAGSSIQACQKDENSAECRVAKNLQEIQKLGLPIGWGQSANLPAWCWSPGPCLLAALGNWALYLLFRIPGWALTALAVSLGAPFWFDVLNKIIVVRSTVKPREKSPEEPPVDR